MGVAANPTAPWIKEPGAYSAAEVADLLRASRDHAWLQFHQGRDQPGEGAAAVIVKGEGNYIWDIAGNRYFDGMAGLYLMNLGHGRTEIVDAIAAQLSTLAYANTGAYATVPAIRLAERLAEKAPGDLNKVFFCNGGGEAVEIALKMARQIQHLRGFPKKTKVIARRGQYHGSTRGAMSLTGPAGYAGVFEPLDPQVRHVEQPACYRCPWGLNDGSVVASGPEPGRGCCLQAVKDLERLIEFEGPCTIAAFIATPNSAADQLPPPGYWPAVRALCDKHDILLVVDEIICAFGRLGRWFGIDHWGVVPDLVTIAKGLSAGYLPCGGVIARAEWADLFEAKGEEFHHGVTYGGHPGVMAAGLATLDVMEREGVVDNSDKLGAYLYEQLVARLYAKHPSVGAVGGGLGLMATLDMVEDRRSRTQRGGDYTRSLTAKVRRRGLALRAGGEVWISPPLTATKAEVDWIVDVLDDAIAEQEREDGVA
jgi:adenosylmethionine-8-amino-7-oxononanoate aminotransferase